MCDIGRILFLCLWEARKICHVQICFEVAEVKLMLEHLGASFGARTSLICEICESRCCFVLRRKFQQLLAYRAQLLEDGAPSKFSDENWGMMWMRFFLGRKLDHG